MVALMLLVPAAQNQTTGFAALDGKAKQVPRLEITEACDVDFDNIANLMDVALEPYYGGDHRAHAVRILKADLIT